MHINEDLFDLQRTCSTSGTVFGVPPLEFFGEIWPRDWRSTRLPASALIVIERSNIQIHPAMPESLVLAKFYREMENPPSKVKSKSNIKEPMHGKWKVYK
jgi:hypothetical protein